MEGGEGGGDSVRIPDQILSHTYIQSQIHTCRDVREMLLALDLRAILLWPPDAVIAFELWAGSWRSSSWRSHLTAVSG